MNYKKLPSALAIAISLELILSPLPANAQAHLSPRTALEILNKGMEAYQGLRGNGQSQGPNTQFGSDMQKLNSQRDATIDKQFSISNMSKIPGLMQYIAKKNQDAAKTGGKQINPGALDCQTLPTTLTETNTEVCRNKTVSTISGINPSDQAHEAMSYYKQYALIEKRYQNFSARSNSGDQAYGVGCMEDAMDILKGFFAYRAEQMDYLNAELDKAFSSFKGQQEAELEAIRRASAELGGEGSKFASEYNDTNLFNYGEKFAGAGCDSIKSVDGMTKLGKELGLTGLNAKIQKDFSDIPAGSNYSPKTYLEGHSKVVADIKSMADRVSEQASINFSQLSASKEGYTNFLTNIGTDVGSDTGVHAGLNKAFFNGLQNKFELSRNKLSSQVGAVRSELGSKGAGAMAMLSDTTSDVSFDAELSTLENEIKGECINKSGIDTALTRMYDPKLSKQANKKSADIIRKRIKAIMSDVRLSPAKKIADLKTIESSGGSRYEMKLDSDYETKEVTAGGVVTKKVSAASKITPTTFFSDVIQNCESQYQVNKLNNKYSAKEAIKQLRALKSTYKKESKAHSKDIKDEIIKNMIDCKGRSDVANSSTVESCSPANLVMSSPNFCAKGAYSCSHNMQKCNEKVSNYTKNLKDKRLSNTKNYNANVDLLRKQLVNSFDNALGMYSEQAESLRGMFGAGFTPPADIERDVEGDKAFNPDFLSNGPDSLKIKDPAVLMTMMKANTKKLKEQIVAQQKEIIGSDGSLQKHIDLTKENYKTHVLGKTKEIMNGCLAAYNSYTQMLMEQKKIESELGEKTALFCSKYADIMVQHNLAACKDSIGDLSKEVIKSANKMQNSSVVAQTSILYKQMEDYCYNNGGQTEKNDKVGKDASDICVAALSDKLLYEAISNSAKNPNDDKAKTPSCYEICSNIGGTGNNTLCGGPSKSELDPVTNKMTNVIPTSCDGLIKKVEAVYKNYNKTLRASAGDTSATTPVTGSFCNASTNSGRQNAKPGYGSSAGPAPANFQNDGSRQ